MKGQAFIFVAVLMLAAGPATAQRVRLDDSLSPADSLHIELHWDGVALAHAMNSPLAGARNPAPATGQLPGVDVRLDTREYVGQQARIYLRLDGVAEATDLEIRFEASGRFLPGVVRPGQTALVFEGPIEQAVTSAVFSFVLTLGDGAVLEQESLEINYEIETLP
jgi:hypothetical protein